MKNKKVVGVIVGRFQTPYLHDGHRYLIDTAKRAGRRIMIAVGVSGGAAGQIDPMNFETRAVMLKSEYPDAIVVMIKDHSSNVFWSSQLDDLVKEYFPRHEVILFGSRDSFLSSYEGKYQKREVRPKIHVCATDSRQKIAATVTNSIDFRAGVIYANTKQIFPTSFQAVDIAIKHSIRNEVLVGRKIGEEGWRFPGGFVDPADQSLEYAARREAIEEVGDIEIADVKYIRSFRINDHRYRKSEHKVMSALFSAVYVFGHILACDDLEEVRWQGLDHLVDCLADTHKPLGQAYLETLHKC